MKKYALLFIFFLFLVSGCSSRSYEDGYADGYSDGYQAAINYAPETESKTIIQNTLPVSPKQDEPENGHYFRKIPDFLYVAPLSIETSGTNGYYFVLDPITLVNNTGGYTSDEYAKLMAVSTDIRLYIRGGSNIEIDVPLGNYEIYYACGETWYSKEELFGPETRYYKCDETFLFEETYSGYNGWTISLTPVPNGNLDTDLISATEFPK